MIVKLKTNNNMGFLVQNILSIYTQRENSRITFIFRYDNIDKHYLMNTLEMAL